MLVLGQTTSAEAADAFPVGGLDHNAYPQLSGALAVPG
jgi:hypothetical protein